MRKNMGENFAQLMSKALKSMGGSFGHLAI
jgi:hypothetical protein